MEATKGLDATLDAKELANAFLNGERIILGPPSEEAHPGPLTAEEDLVVNALRAFAVSETVPQTTCIGAIEGHMGQITHCEKCGLRYPRLCEHSLCPMKEAASAPSATPQKPPRDPNVKYPRLFYWEDAEDCWCPADELRVENIIDTELFLADGERSEIRFKRMDMTDAEYAAIPEG